VARAEEQRRNGRAIALMNGLRLPFLTGSVLPVWAAAALVSLDHRVDPVDLTLATLAVAALHLASNLVNDAADSDNTDRINRFRTPYSGGSGVLLDGTLTRAGLWAIVVVLVGIAIGAGIGLTLRGRPLVWLLGMAGGLLGLGYSASGARLMSRGLGELAIFVSFGPLLTLASGYVLTGRFDPRQLALGTLPGFLITAVLWINQFPDRDADAAVGKRNLVVRMSPGSARLVYAALMFGPFVAAAACVAGHVLPAATLAIVPALPIAGRAVWQLRRAAGEPAAVLPVQGLTILSHSALTALLVVGLAILGHA
jgi:1,4-dihydroxy-2-naphthoate polyprenyltransferase